MEGFKIKSVKAREILDSRGNPTVEVEIETNDGVFMASVPSGASTGKREAKELRDGSARYNGMGVLKAVRNVNEIIAPKIKGKDVREQKKIDDIMIKMDGTKDKSQLGANAILAVSMAVCRAGAKAKRMPIYKYVKHHYNNAFCGVFKFPNPCFNIINGGAHAGNELDFQEFMIVPRFKKYAKNLQVGCEIYFVLKKILEKDFGKSATNIGDEGGFAPQLRFPEQALDLIQKAIKQAGYKNKVKIALDVAASQFYIKGKYEMEKKKMSFTRQEFLDYYQDLIKKYPIISIEDGFAEDDWEGFQMMTKKFGKKVINIGDDLLTTNSDRMTQAKNKNACNGLLLKLNQIGTVSEALEAARLARSFDWKIMVSHRSGETNDDFIADFAVGISSDFIKAGAPARGERLAKYNRLLRIEEEL